MRIRYNPSRITPDAWMHFFGSIETEQLYQRILFDGFCADIVNRVACLGGCNCTSQSYGCLITGITCFKKVIKAHMFQQEMKGLSMIMMAKMT